MLADRRQQADARFRTLVLNWLESLPPGGWEGTSHELGDALAAFADRRKLVAFVPTCPARKVAVLAGFHGFALTHRRTKHARTIRLSRR
jgi:hypothetical protein